jgi:hypothetical protein
MSATELAGSWSYTFDYDEYYNSLGMSNDSGISYMTIELTMNDYGEVYNIYSYYYTTGKTDCSIQQGTYEVVGNTLIFSWDFWAGTVDGEWYSDYYDTISTESVNFSASANTLDFAGEEYVRSTPSPLWSFDHKNNLDNPSTAITNDLVGTWGYDLYGMLLEYSFNNNGECYCLIVVNDGGVNYWAVAAGTYTVSGSSLTIYFDLAVTEGSIGNEVNHFDPPETFEASYSLSGGNLYIDGMELELPPSSPSPLWSFEHRYRY